MINPKISIITVSFNSVKTICDTIESVLSQTYPDIEYIILDGSSSDGTVELVNSFGSRISKFISEPDKGIYDAINKGIRIATGNIIGILHSDDFFYSNNVIEKVADSFNEYEIDAVFGDAQFVDPINTSKIVRYYSSKLFSITRFKFGYMPAHPSFYVKKEFFEKLGYYKVDYKIAADFELLVRFLYINKIKYKYLNIPFISMRTGGISNRSIHSKYILNKEIARACKENGIKTNYFFIYSKYFSKLFEFMFNNNDKGTDHRLK
jgi:glycosyltransferase involved in cell wall biosynthesis